MKAARPVPADHSSSRRAQPVRQTRNNPPRSSGLLSRSFSARDASGGGLGNGQNLEQRTKIYPAITYFADAITALPKELMRHFTLLKEVDAKIFTPEDALAKYVEAALNAPIPPPKLQTEGGQSAGPTSAPDSAPMSVNGSIMNGVNTFGASAHDAVDNVNGVNAAWDPANNARRALFRQCATTMQGMLVSLDEKNHVISTATEALNKQIARLDDCFPHLEQEISEEARYGSDKHWAYMETRTSKPVEKSRREVAAQISNGYSVTVDEAAARSDARKQAMLAKKSRLQPAESDFDDHLDHRSKNDLAKKPHGNSKKGRPADAVANHSPNITNGNGTNGNPPSKRRKVDKATAGGAAMERSMSAVFGSNGVASKGKANSPSDTPVPESSKRKAKSSATANGHVRKRAVASVSNAMSPSLASSPIQSTFADSKSLGRTSPIPTNGARQNTARARQNSTQSVIDSSRQRPSSSSSNKPNGTTIGASDLGAVAGITGRSIPEVRVSMKETVLNSKGEHMLEDADEEDPEMKGGLVVGSRKDSLLKREDTEVNGTNLPPTINTTITMTKSGRASKPSTPALSSFPDSARSRSSRTALEQTANSHNKRSHKKGAGQAAQQQQQIIAAAAASHPNDDDGTKTGQSDEEDLEIDADEPTYCYCNGVSYGEMVACDADGCAKEWFHLDCVGLKVAPKGNAKWYCDDCKEIMKNNKRFNGR